MSNRNHIQTKVNTLIIKKPFEKIRFQIRHPENAFAVIGIAISTNLYLLNLNGGFNVGGMSGSSPTLPATIDTNLETIAGKINLAIPDKGDVVYTDDVHISNNNFIDISQSRINATLSTLNFIQVNQNFSVSGKQFTFFETFYKIKSAILEGYYESNYLPPPPIQFSTPLYQVKVYIKYQMK